MEYDFFVNDFLLELGILIIYVVLLMSLRCVDGNGSEKEGNSLIY